MTTGPDQGVLKPVLSLFPSAQSLPRPTLTEEAGLNIELLFVMRSSGFMYALQHSLKRLLDITLTTLGLALILPVLLLIAIAIKATSAGPILYKSERIGKNYQPFWMYKFRTMRADADQMRDTLRKNAQLEGNLFKLRDDPRITPIGKFLRAYSLDELPQLLNVLRGEMSLVGPRPLPPDESELFETPYTLRFMVTPGMTGIWQVSGRSQLDFKKMCLLELSYVYHWSFWEDIIILLKTGPAVLLKKGAC